MGVGHPIDVGVCSDISRGPMDGVERPARAGDAEDPKDGTEPLGEG